MVIANLDRNIVVVQITRHLKIHHGNLRMQQRRVHPLTLTGYLTLQESRQNSNRAVKPSTQIGHRNARPHRPGLCVACHRHQAPHALKDLIKARSQCIGPVLSKPRNTGQDDPGVHTRQRFVIEPKLGLDLGSPILNDDIGSFHQFHQNRQCTRLFQIQGHGALVAVEVLKVASLAFALKQHLIGVHARRWLNADHISAKVRQDTNAVGAGPDTRQVQDAKSRQCTGGLDFRHGEEQLSKNNSGKNG